MPVKFSEHDCDGIDIGPGRAAWLWIAIEHNREKQSLAGCRRYVTGKRVGPAQRPGFGANVAGSRGSFHSTPQGAVNASNWKRIQINFSGPMAAHILQQGD